LKKIELELSRRVRRQRLDLLLEPLGPGFWVAVSDWRSDLTVVAVAAGR